MIETSLLVATKEDVVGLLRRVAHDLDRLERSLVLGSKTLSLAAASHAVHLALVELEPCA